MVQLVTKGIKISVKTGFEGAFFKNYRTHFAFRYQITIENQSKDWVQLISRSWKIGDSLNKPETVKGEGVVGKKPVIKPGESHTYTSGCLLLSPFGAMKGFFNMISFSTTRQFRVAIPVFQLCAPYAMN